MRTATNKNAHVIAQSLLNKGLKVCYRQDGVKVQLFVRLNTKKALLVTCKTGGHFDVYPVVEGKLSPVVKIRGLDKLTTAYPFLG